MLNRGDFGADVAEWQAFLRAEGYGNWQGGVLIVTGDFDQETEYATMCLQRDHGLEPTGVLCLRTDALARTLGWRAGE